MPEKVLVMLYLQKYILQSYFLFFHVYFSTLVWISIFEANLPIALDYFPLIHITGWTCEEGEAGPGFLFNEIKPKNASQACTK